jgi:hypothetical protein
VSLVGLGLNPDSEEFGTQVALARSLQVEVAAVEGIAEVEMIVEESLRRVGVRVDHEGGTVHRFRRLSFRLCHGGSWAGCVLAPNECRDGYKKNDEY